MENDARLEATIAAIADPTRRAVINLLRHEPMRAGELAVALAMTAPALSRHLRVLRETGLVIEEVITDDARVRVYRLQPGALLPLNAWLEAVESLWATQLGAFKWHAESKTRRK